LRRDVYPCVQASGKREKVTITVEKGRLSKEEIQRLVDEAEEFAEVRHRALRVQSMQFVAAPVCR
jgi:heat shock protein 5